MERSGWAALVASATLIAVGGRTSASMAQSNQVAEVQVGCANKGGPPINISTGAGPWMVASAPAAAAVPPGSPAVQVAPLHPLWSASLPPGVWVSHLASSGNSSVPQGHYVYALKVHVRCQAGITARLTGNVAGDDAVAATLTGPGPSGPTVTLGSTPGNVGYGFVTGHDFSIGGTLSQGHYKLQMDVNNSPAGGSPHGLLVGAQLLAY